VKFTITLLDTKHTKYFYRNPAAEKLTVIERVKSIAAEFFKMGNYAKAGKIYQRIIGFYSFGDVANNYLKEQGPEFEANSFRLETLKVVCFTNLVVCKFKCNEFQSVIAITDQILDMDANSAKALWFRGRSYLQIE
jgi:hypothetical protein